MTRKHTGREPGRPADRHSQAEVDARSLRELHRRQTRLWLAQGRALEDRIKAKRAEDPRYLLSEDERELLAEVDVFLGRTTTGALNVQRALDAAVQSVPTEVLRAELHHELLQAAHSWSDEEWAAVLRVYEARQKVRAA